MIFEMKNIVKMYGSLCANDDVSLHLKRGEILAIVGENGAGKSTIMKILYGLEKATSGEIYVNGNKTNFRNPSDAMAAGIGMASVVTGVLFLLATFLSPLVAVVPHEAATPALVIVGFLMMQQVTGIDWDDLEIALPAFLTIVLMPFTYSITAGIGAGFVAYVLLQVVRGKGRQVHVLMWIVAVLFLVYFGIDPIQGWLGL